MSEKMPNGSNGPGPALPADGNLDSATWVMTDPEGLILGVSPSGARLLSASARGLQQRSLLLFFEQDRDGWRAASMRASRGECVELSGRLRPKDRRPVLVGVRIEPADSLRPALRWTFVPEPAHPRS
jgi:hypothetical protein